MFFGATRETVRVRVESGGPRGEDLEEQPAARGMGPRRAPRPEDRGRARECSGGGRAVAVAWGRTASPGMALNLSMRTALILSMSYSIGGKKRGRRAVGIGVGGVAGGRNRIGEDLAGAALWSDTELTTALWSAIKSGTPTHWSAFSRARPGARCSSAIRGWPRLYSSHRVRSPRDGESPDILRRGPLD